MAKLGDAGLKGGLNNFVKPAELYENSTVFDITGAAYADFRGDPQVKFTVEFDGKETSMSLAFSEYREKFIAYFADGGERLEGVHLVKVGSKDAWGFDDGEFAPPAPKDVNDIPF